MTESAASQGPIPFGEEDAPTLASLGLNEEVLTGAVRQGVQQATNITAFHPVTTRGFVQWAETVASLRQALADKDWEISDPQNSPRVSSPDGKTSILVIGGNADTGRSPKVMPRTARRRGPTTHAAVESNGPGLGLRGGVQGVLIEMPRPAEESQTWVLLYYWSTDSAEVRAELSLPLSIEAGEITTWGPRILLPRQDLTEFEIPALPTGPQHDVEFTIEELP